MAGKSGNKGLIIVALVAGAMAALWALGKKGAAGGASMTGQFSIEGHGMGASGIGADSIGLGEPNTSFVESATVRFVGTVKNNNTVPIDFRVILTVKIAGVVFAIVQTFGTQTIPAGETFTLAGNTLTVPVLSTSPVGQITATATLLAAQSGVTALPFVQELLSGPLGDVLPAFSATKIIFTGAPGFTIG